ncbi:hypothetical protein [Streptomyces sp. NPDC007083]|uniref:hypothetical protein n=1 Tax=unclassified Streptomyces TaxID=2593676 RepID=UPI0033C88FB2
MRLNHALPPDGAGSAAASDEPSLVVHQDDLGAVGHEAFKLHGAQAPHRAGRWASRS